MAHARCRFQLRHSRTKTHHRRGIEGANQLLTNVDQVNTNGSRWFSNELHRAKLESFYGGLVEISRLRGTDDDYRTRRVAHDSLESGEPIHSRHRNVERDNVGLEQPNLLERFYAVRGCSYDAKVIAEFDDFGDETAHERTVVDHEHPLCWLNHAFLDSCSSLQSPVNAFSGPHRSEPFP